MVNLNLKALDVDLTIKGDDNAVRTITIGQQVTFSDEIVFDTATFSFNGTALAVPQVNTGPLLQDVEDGEHFLNLTGTSEAGSSKPISSWTAGNTIQGFARCYVNGVVRWVPFYDAPTS